MSAAKALVSFYTIFHMEITQEDMDDMEKNFHLTPLVGLLFGFMLFIEAAILVVLNDKIGFGNGFVIAVLMLLTVYAGSKFLHFDGLTDFGDGMIVSGERSDHVRALKDTLVGAGGIGVAMITVLCSVAFYTMYTGRYEYIFLLPMIEVFVKNAMVAAAAYGEPGNGMAARQVSLTYSDSMVKATFVSLISSFILLCLSIGFLNLYLGMDATHVAYIGLEAIVVGLIVSIAVGYLMAKNANDVFGMVNGDILGATNEISRPFLAFFIILIVLAISAVS